MTKMTRKSNLQCKKANVVGLRSVSKAYKSNVEPMEQPKIKETKEPESNLSQSTAEGQASRDEGKRSASLRKARVLWRSVYVPQPPPSTRCVRYTRREWIKTQLKYLQEKQNSDLA